MTALDVLAVARTRGILLQVHGDRLHVEASPGALTPELRSALVEKKAELLALLAPSSRVLVTLKNGPTLPVEAITLALDLERRGFKMSLDDHQQFQIEPAPALTDADTAAIHRWRLHLGAIIHYNADAPERPQ